MVGNDIVDLIETKKTTNWQRPRFLDKLFTLKEQELIKSCKDSFLMVWRLWSMKEAAYKLYTQLYPSRFYNPKGFACDIKQLKVHYRNFQCFIKTKITANYILSEARLVDYAMTSKVVMFNDNPLETQSNMLKTQLSEFCNTTRERMDFNKNKFGVPTINYKAQRVTISMTHHGNYGAFAVA